MQIPIMLPLQNVIAGARRFALSGTALLFFVFAGCVDQEFDQPPPGGFDPNLSVNATIAEVKAMHTLGQYEEITDDIVFDALVISNDAQGNFFKQLVIADETGGIEIRIDVNDLHNVYPVGRKVYVKAKGLWMSDYNGLIQLGAGKGVSAGGDDELIRIPESVVERYIVTATYGHDVIPTPITIDQITPNMVSTLVRIDDVQFVSADAGETYADAVLQLTVNREIEDCAKRRLIVRTSGFASFAGTPTPTNNGTIIGIMSVFRDDYQLMIRDLNDVSFTNERCSSATLTVAQVRNAFTGSATAAPAGTIKGVVISDLASQSVTGANLYLQDATGGIVLRFSSNHSAALGSEIAVDLSGGTLEEFNGLLQVNNLNTAGISVEGNPGDVTPRVATVLEVLNNAEAWESTLVQINNATLSGNTVYSGSVTVTDATGSMVLFTRNQSTFSSTALPTGEVTLKAIVSQFTTPQLIIRNLNDVSGGGSGSQEIDESFTSVANDDDIMLPGWANIAVKGDRLWRAKVFSGNHYAQATAFNDTAAEQESWLITPAIELDAAKKLTFESAYAFWEHDGLSVWISSDFNGSDVTGATWVQLNPRLAMESDTEHEFIGSGDIDLSGFTGPVRIGFKYVGSGPGGLTTSSRIDNVKVSPL